MKIMLKNIFYYDDMSLPTLIRIKSEELCLDHTFSPEISAFSKPLSFSTLVNLANNPVFDVTVKFPKGALYYVNMDGELETDEIILHLNEEVRLLPVKDYFSTSLPIISH